MLFSTPSMSVSCFRYCTGYREGEEVNDDIPCRMSKCTITVRSLHPTVTGPPCRVLGVVQVLQEQRAVPEPVGDVIPT